MYLVNLLVALASMFMLAASIPLQNLDNWYISWDQVPTSTHVEWNSCPRTMRDHTSFLCMRLQVPLDYEAPEQGTTTIAFMKSPALKPSRDTKDIFINFGGPGVGTIDILPNWIHAQRVLTGPSHNIVAFDPRGVGYSGPNTDCFQGDTIAAQLLAAKYTRYKPPHPDQATNETLAFTDEWGNLCQKNLDTAARYIGTSAVARDMLHFAELQAHANGNNPAAALVDFLGHSYGTALGATFATLYPEHTGRMVLDGVVDGDYYYAGHSQDMIAGVDQVIRAFFQQCSTAGPQRCSFWEDSPEKIEARLDKLLESLLRNPIQLDVGGIPVDEPALFTDLETRRMIKSEAYHGHRTFQVLASSLAGLEARDQKTVDQARYFISIPPCSRCTRRDLERLLKIFTPSNNNPFHSNVIKCTDADGRYNISTPAIYEQSLLTDLEISKYAGDLFIVDTALCRKWPFRQPPSQRFNGIFGARTKNPILILSNTYDVATPLMHAQRLETQFEGSVLLTQDAVNHCALGLYSRCTYQYVREYFEYGTLPPPKTVCLPYTKSSFYPRSWFSPYGKAVSFPQLGNM